MKVTYFTESLYPHVDGVSRTLARLFDTLERREVDFEVYSPFVPESEIPWSSRVRGVRFVRFPPYPDYRVSLPAISSIRSELLAHPPDLVHVVSPTPLAFRAQRLARRLGIPVVASFHTDFVSYFRYYGVSKLEGLGWAMLRRFYRGCARVYCPTESTRGELEANGIQNVSIWSRGIDPAAFSPDFRDRDLLVAHGADPSLPTLLLVSRLVKEKDLGDLIAVDRVLRQRGVAYNFVLVGDGPLYRTLRAALPRAIFAGHRSGEDLARWYASADVFVLPSTTETLGNVVLEALASGLPAVVVDRGGPQDLIEPARNGYIAAANEPEEIARYVGTLLLDESLRTRMSANARDSAVRRDWETINGSLLESYAEVIAREPKRHMASGAG